MVPLWDRILLLNLRLGSEGKKRHCIGSHQVVLSSRRIGSLVHCLCYNSFEVVVVVGILRLPIDFFARSKDRSLFSSLACLSFAKIVSFHFEIDSICPLLDKKTLQPRYP